MASTCSRCGTVSDEGDGATGAADPAAEDVLPLGWSLATSARGVTRLCERCTREHVRDIEAKLDEEWWG